MQFHWKDRAIWRDILALPPQVMLSRLAKRAGFKAKRKKLEVESQSSPLENILERQKLSANLDQQILTFLSEKYLNADGDFLGSGWQNQFVGSSSMGFLGSSPTNDQKFKPYIQWQKDVKSGFFWDIERLSSEQLGIGLNAKGADVKVPWEFARMHQFVKIALSNKEEGPEILKNRLLDDFMSANPVGRGVHWMNAMEVAIRAINLMVSFDLMGNADTKVSAAIQTHIAFVFNHLERKDGLGNNHYLANLVGLLFGLVYYPKWEDLQEKKSYIISEFSAELQKQFYQEGGNFEGSTYYHALSTELAILGTSCLLRLKHKSTKTVGEITYKALHFLKVVAKSNHELPQIGDNDSGRILPLSPYGSWATPEEIEKKYAHLSGYAKSTEQKQFFENPLSIQPILDMGNALFGELSDSAEAYFITRLGSFKTDKFNEPTFKFQPDDPGVVLPYEKEWEVSFENIDLEKIKATYLSDFGLVILKSDEFYLSISLLERRKAHRYRGHFHNDQLSIDLWVKGQQLLSDPGLVTYTGDMELRNAMRSAKAHNAPYLGEEPNRFMGGLVGLFHMMDETNTELFQFSETKIRAGLFFKNEKVIRDISVFNNKIVVHDSASKPFELNLKNEVRSDGYGRILRNVD